MSKEDYVEIVIIEDNIYDAELIIRTLQKYQPKANLLHISDAVEALEFLSGVGNLTPVESKPKAIFLDLKMPKINGLELLKRIKANPATQKIPVVILTSSKESTDVEHCYEYGANSYIVKPIEFDQFAKAISEAGLYWLLLNHPGVQDKNLPNE